MDDLTKILFSVVSYNAIHSNGIDITYNWDERIYE